MRSARVLLFVGLFAFAFVPGVAQAQDQPVVRFIVGIGGGQGSASLRCDGCLTAKQNEPSGYFRVGRLIRSGLVVGGEIDTWLQTSDDGDQRFNVSTADAFGQWYLRRGFFVTGGIGISRIQTEIDIVQQGLPLTVLQSDTGLGFHAGAGYEFQFAPHTAFIPFATFFGTQGVEFADTGPFNAYVFVLGIGLSLN